MECIDCGGTPIEANGLCASCNHKKRKAEREARKYKVFNPVKKVTEKRAEENKEYSKLRKQFLLHKMACEMKFHGCSITATTVHHTSKSHQNFLNTDTWIAACLYCHSVAEAMPAEELREIGLLTD